MKLKKNLQTLRVIQESVYKIQFDPYRPILKAQIQHFLVLTHIRKRLKGFLTRNFSQTVKLKDTGKHYRYRNKRQDVFDFFQTIIDYRLLN